MKGRGLKAAMADLAEKGSALVPVVLLASVPMVIEELLSSDRFDLLSELLFWWVPLVVVGFGEAAAPPEGFFILL